MMSIPPFYMRYMDLVNSENLTQELIIQGDQALDFYRSIMEAFADYRYADNKWSIKEILGHVMDAERIFSYRILRFARNDNTALPGFDENKYVPELNLSAKKFHNQINEFANLRTSTIDLVSSLNAEMLERSGEASNVIWKVKEIVRVMIGHEIHHRNIIKERYFD